VKTEKLGGVAGGEGECGDNVAEALRFCSPQVSENIEIPLTITRSHGSVRVLYHTLTR